jgi:hypothetical protein
MKKSQKTVAQAVRASESGTPDRETTIQENMVDAGRRHMQKELEEYHSVSPILSGGDVDANWQRGEVSGDETVGGHAVTPDQNVVEELGRATGIEFQDNQELHTHDEVLAKRDRHRWELDPRSADDAANQE